MKNVKDVYIQEIYGGSRVNVIPRDFKVTFFMKKDNLKKVNKMLEEQKNFYGDVNIEILPKNENTKALSREITTQIIGFISNYENGAIEYENGNVILSCNMAAIREDEANIYIEYSTRANNMKLRNEYLERLEKLVKKYELKIIWSQELKGVEQDIYNSLITKCNNTYQKMYQKDLEKMMTQGVVEGGFFSDKIKDLEYVCIGPNTEDVHSPNERLSIPSLQRTWEYLKNVIES